MITILRNILLTGFFISAMNVHAQFKGDSTTSPEQIVEDLYDLVSIYPGQDIRWDQVRSLFLKEAVIVLRTKKDETTIFNVDGFVDDFIRFIERAQVKTTGFTEKIIRKKTMLMGDMAHVLVLYEASIPGSTNPPQRGVDSFSLIKKDNRWWIVSVTNEIPTLEIPIPEFLQK